MSIFKMNQIFRDLIDFLYYNLSLHINIVMH